MKGIWLNYYNKNDPDARPAGRVRVFRVDGATEALYITGMRNYKELMKRLRADDPSANLAFMAAPEYANWWVFVKTYDVDYKAHYQFCGEVERVF